MFDAFAKETLYEYPSFKVALFSILLSFVLSCLIALTYHVTNRGLGLSRNFVQAMVLSSIVTCMVIMAVGNNIAAGFGIIGAIAIVRFRMRVENPRNIIFMFASLSVGIATGVYGYSIALAGTVTFSLVAILLYFSQYGRNSLIREFLLLVTVNREVPDETLTNYLVDNCEYFRLIEVNTTNTGRRFKYFVMLKKDIDKLSFFRSFETQEGLTNVKLERDDNLDKI